MSSGTVAIWALKDGDYNPTEFAGTTVGLQAAIDYLAGTRGKVFVGAGVLETSAAIWIHAYCHLQGAGRGQTIIKRAAGSITDADPANSGCVIGTSAYGANGTLSSSASIQYDIEISDITLDGNSGAFGALTSGTPHQAGILAKSVDGLKIHDVTVQNTLRSGFMLVECKDVVCSRVRADTTGQFSVVTTRNAFDFYNYGAATTGHGVNYILSDFEVYTCGDEAVSLTSVSDVAITNGYVDGCDFVLEIQSDASGTTCSRISMVGVQAKNLLGYPITLYTLTTGLIKDVEISNCTFAGHATLHDAGGISANSASSQGIKTLHVHGCEFTSMNSKDTASRNMIDCICSGAGRNEDWKIRDCKFSGPGASSATVTYGIIMQGNVGDMVFDGVVVENVSAIAFALWGTSGLTSTSRNFRFINCEARNIGNHGWFIGANYTTTTITDVLLDNCEAMDVGTLTANSVGFSLQNNAAGSTSRVYVRGCRGRIISAANFAKGLLIVAGGGTYDSVYIADCDFEDIATPLQVNAGVTNVRFQPRIGKGTNIASAATIVMPSNGDVFHVTGATNITNGITVNAWDNGRTAKLIFDDILTVTDTGTSVLQGNFTSAANDVLCLVCDGTNWVEVSRN